MTLNIDKLRRTQIKPYTLDKEFKVFFDGVCFMSYSNLDMAIYCKSVIPNSYLVEHAS